MIVSDPDPTCQVNTDLDLDRTCQVITDLDPTCQVISHLDPDREKVSDPGGSGSATPVSVLIFYIF